MFTVDNEGGKLFEGVFPFFLGAVATNDEDVVRMVAPYPVESEKAQDRSDSGED